MNPVRKEPNIASYAGRFAIRLRALRKKSGLSVEDVAEALGIPPSSYYNWESARSLPSIDKLPELAEVLGVKIRTILPEK